MAYHKVKLMRPRSALVERLTGEYPESVNTALERYLYLMSNPPEFSEAEWNLIYDACNGLMTQGVPTEILVGGLAQQIEDAIAYRQLDKKYNVEASALLPRLINLSSVEELAIIYNVERFWSE